MSMCSYAHAGRADEHAFMNSAHLLIAQNCTRYDHDFENLTNSDSSIGRTTKHPLVDGSNLSRRIFF